MAKTNILEWDATANNNTDMNGVGILGSNNVNNFDNAFRELMAQGAANIVSRFTSRAAGYTALKADHNQISIFTASATLSLTAAATLTNGWQHFVIASGGDVTIDPNASELINGLATITVLNGQRATIWCNGTAFYASVVGEATIGVAVQGKLYGLTLSNNGADATNDIDIATGSAASDGSTSYLMTLSSALTKRLDSGWAVGTGNGGLDTGSIANTTYHVFLIQRSDTGVVDALFSASATSPTMPTNYDRKRRIGSIIRSGATILAFRQFGDRFMLSTTVQARSSTAAFADAVLTVTAPAGIRTRPILNSILSCNAATSVQNGFGDGDASAISYFGQIVTGQTASATQIETIYTNTSSQIRFLCQINSGSIVSNTLNSVGWWDDRGING